MFLLTPQRLIGLVPDYATEESHPEQRGICKTLFYAQGYGAGPGYVKNPKLVAQ